MTWSTKLDNWYIYSQCSSYIHWALFPTQFGFIQFSFSEVVHRLRMRNRKSPNRKRAKYKIFGSPQTGLYAVSGEIPCSRGLIQIVQPSSLSDTIWTRRRLRELRTMRFAGLEQINQGGRGELYWPLQSLFSPHWCQQPETKVCSYQSPTCSTQDYSPPPGPCYPCQECDLTGPPWLESLLADLAPCPHLSASSSP